MRELIYVSLITTSFLEVLHNFITLLVYFSLKMLVQIYNPKFKLNARVVTVDIKPRKIFRLGKLLYNLRIASNTPINRTQ